MAARLFRSLKGPVTNWGELIAAAQVTVSHYQEYPFHRARELYNERDALPLIAAARILDCAARESSDIPREERAGLGLLSAVAFGMYGNFPSAAAAVEQTLPLLDGVSPVLAAVLCSASPRHIDTLLPSTQELDAAANYVEQLVTFLKHGDESAFSESQHRLDDCWSDAGSALEGYLFRCARLCLAHIGELCVAKVLSKHCPGLPDDYVGRLLQQGVRVFLPPQYRAITERDVVNAKANTILALPTSTGKTLLGELCLVSALGGSPGVVCYLTPYVALGRQVANSLQQHLPSRFRIRRLIGGYEEARGLAPEINSEVLVATPERLDATLRSSPEIIPYLRCIVCDEAHLVENDVRGVRLEGILTRLRLFSSKAPVRILLLSGVLSRYRALQEWLEVPDELVVTDSWRPTARRLAIWTQQGRLQWYFGSELVRPAGTSEKALLGFRELVWPATRMYATELIGQIRSQEPRVHYNVAYLAEQLYREYGGAVLCVCGTKSATRRLAIQLAERFDELEPPPLGISKIIENIEEKHAFLRPMCDLLRHGVVYHNASLPHVIRRLIESAITDGEFRAVASTTTLAEGVDFPFRVTIIADWLTGYATSQGPMPSLLFRNVAGRCGRAGVFTEGDTVIFDNPLGNTRYTEVSSRREIQEEMFIHPRAIEVKSALEVLKDGGNHGQWIATLASQFMAAIPENPTDNDLVTSFLENTLWLRRERGNQKSRQLLSSIRNSLLDDSEVPLAIASSPLTLTEFGARANETGFSPESCRLILRFMKQNRQHVDILSVGCALLRELGTLPEQTNRVLREALSNPRNRQYVKGSDIDSILSHWLQHKSREEIFSSLPTVRRSTRVPRIDHWLSGTAGWTSWDDEFDKFVDLTGSVIEGYLPWLMRACGKLSAFQGGWAMAVDWAACAKTFEVPPELDASENESEP